MLHELDIENYAVVETLRVGFHEGLNLLTGETGSGKSIVVDSLALLFGERASADLVRAGAGKARISGVFDAPTAKEFEALAEEFGIEDGELILERQILASGKTRAYVNGRAMTVSILRQLAPLLGDIHGQHDQQELFSEKAQLAMIDAFANVSKQVARVSQVYAEWRAAQAKLAELRGSEQERLRLLDLYKFQNQEIAEASLSPDEDGRLGGERSRLQNVEQLREAGSRAYDALYESSESASTQLKSAQDALDELAGVDSSHAESRESIAAARAAVEDVAFELQKYLDSLEADPRRLEDIEDRLAMIDRLKRKYGRTLEEVIAYGEEVRAKVAQLDSSEESAAALEAEIGRIREKYLQLAEALSAKRKKAAEKLGKLVQAELGAVALQKAQFHIATEPGEPSAGGIDRIRFEFSANPGQPLKLLAEVASGGELSRLTLALKTCLAPRGSRKRSGVARTLVFDEIDTGVGGRVAEAIGRRLKGLAGANQVLCVTHLPQVAGFADAHYFVDKAEKNGQTFATISELSSSERVAERARMLSGEEVTKAAEQNARQILKRAKSA